jgi:hypothetical protein
MSNPGPGGKGEYWEGYFIGGYHDTTSTTSLGCSDLLDISDTKASYILISNLSPYSFYQPLIPILFCGALQMSLLAHDVPLSENKTPYPRKFFLCHVV